MLDDSFYAVGGDAVVVEGVVDVGDKCSTGEGWFSKEVQR